MMVLNRNLCADLKKALYGLQQSFRAWFRKFTNEMINLKLL